VRLAAAGAGTAALPAPLLKPEGDSEDEPLEGGTRRRRTDAQDFCVVLGIALLVLIAVLICCQLNATRRLELQVSHLMYAMAAMTGRMHPVGGGR
jgi:hypothetical protein